MKIKFHTVWGNTNQYFLEKIYSPSLKLWKRPSSLFDYLFKPAMYYDIIYGIYCYNCGTVWKVGCHNSWKIIYFHSHLQAT